MCVCVLCVRTRTRVSCLCVVSVCMCCVQCWASYFLKITIIIIIKLFKGVHKRHVPVQGDTLTYNLYNYKNTITKTEQHIYTIQVQN